MAKKAKKREVSSVALEVTYTPVSSLKPYLPNARHHTRRQIRQIADSIEAFGFTNPVLIDGEHQIIAGHGRVAAADLLGLECVPTIRLENLSEEERRAYVITDNRLAELSSWDKDMLKMELGELAALDLDIDLEVTGFATGEIDVLIRDTDDESSWETPQDKPGRVEDNAISQPGDLFLLGRHRLLCGDATRAECYEQLLEGEKAEMVFTDPPYNVPIDGHVSGLGTRKHREFSMATGEMSSREFETFLTTACRCMADVSDDGAIHFLCMDWRHLREMIAAGDAVYADLKNICVWAKTNAGMGSFYRSRHEMILVYKVGRAAHINNVSLGKNGRYRTNVWEYPGVNSFGAERDAALDAHPTVKPTLMVADAIMDCSSSDGLVLDPFGGSGTTLIAAEKTGRRAALMELDPHYVDSIIRRWQALTGEKAIHVSTGVTFDALEDLLGPDKEKQHDE